MKKALRVLLVVGALLAQAWANPVDDLSDALRDGDLTAIKAAVKKNPALIKMEMETSAASKGNTMLNQAAFWGRLDVVKFLVVRGSDIEHHGFSDSTPLGSAAFMGQVEVVKYLLSKHANVNARGNIGGTPLHEAVFGDQVECIKLLLAAGADIEARDDLKNTPLCKAGDRGNTEIVKLLLKKGANPNAKGFMDKSVLELTKDPACRKLLQKAGAR